MVSNWRSPWAECSINISVWLRSVLAGDVCAGTMPEGGGGGGGGKEHS